MLENPTVWVAVSFIIFVVAAFRPVSKAITAALDSRADRIQKELNEALRLKEEAQSLLATYQRRQSEIEGEALKIIERAQEESKRIAQSLEEELEDKLNRRIEAGMQRIANYEANVLQEIRNNTVDVAIETVNSLLAEYAQQHSADDTVDYAIDGMRKKFH